MSINGNSNVKTRQELITIINESEDQYVIRRAMDEPNADATVLDAAYERAKELCEEDKEKEYILSNVISDIAG